MTGEKGTEAVLVRELLRVFEPVETAIEEGPAGVASLFADAGVPLEALGIDAVNELVAEVNAVQQAFDPVREAIGAGEIPTPEEVTTLFETVMGFDDFPLPEPPDGTAIPGIGTAIVDHLLVRYLRAHHPRVYVHCRLAGVVEVPAGAHPESLGSLRLDRVPELLADPTGAVATTVGWGTESFDASLLVEGLAWLFEAFGLGSQVDPPFSPAQAALFEAAGTADPANYRVPGELAEELAVPAVHSPHGPFGFRVVPVPETVDHHPGVALVPFGPFDAVGRQFTTAIGDDWTFTGDLAVHAEPWGLVVQPPKAEGAETLVAFRALDPGDAAGLPVEAGARAALEYDATSEGAYRPLFGTADGSRLALGALSAAVTAEYDDGSLLVGAQLPARGRLVIEPRGGFLSRVLPSSTTFDFETVVGWSTAAGLSLGGEGSLEATLPQHFDFGFGTLREIHLALGVDEGQLTAEAAASAALELGPLRVTADRVGVDAAVSFPESADGTLGPVDLELGFRPPDGVGIDVDAGAVTGGGYLSYDPERERYAGAVELQVGTLGLSAVGVLTTRLPDGSEGFSLLVVIAGEFPPVQLGFGFTLNAVGGLLGLNRQLRAAPLREAVRTGRLDSVLFPEDVVGNVDRILSDLEAVFPAERDVHVFGPMVRLGWSTPPILTADLGVVLEVPSFRVTLLGSIDVALPNQEVDPSVVDLHLDAVGIIDVPGERLSIDATLYDSRVAAWTVAGEMALRSSWGDDPSFLLSVGGYHPTYAVPEGFPTPERVRVSLDVPGGNPSIEFTGYFAVTSNTLQVGARAAAAFEAGPISARGAFGFDALFYTDPFRFLVDVFARLAVEVAGYGLTIDFDGQLSGPTPFRIRGAISASIGPFTFSAHANVALGEERAAAPLPTASVLPELVAALDHPKNWSAQLPAGGEPLVTLRETRAEPPAERERSTDVLAHPLGTLTVRQTVVPLRYRIERFGNATPATHDTFRIADARFTDRDTNPSGREVTEAFAPAQYRLLSDEEKLTSADFVDLRAGTSLTESGVAHGGQPDAGNVTNARLSYEQLVYDETTDTAGAALEDLLAAVGETATDGHATAVARALAADGAVAGAASRHTGTQRFAIENAETLAADADGGIDLTGTRFEASVQASHEDAGAFSLDATTYVVVFRETMAPVELAVETDNEGLTELEAHDALTAHTALEPTDAGQLQVVPSFRVPEVSQ